MNRVKEEMDKITIPDDLHRKRDIGIYRAKSEMTRKERRLLLKIATASVPLLVLVISILYFNNNRPPQNQIIETDYIIDILNAEAVVDFADNVFVGKVKEQLDTIKNHYPETKFKIKVLENIKGELNETELINQIGGYDGKVLVLMENDELIKEDYTYLFATISDEENDTKTIIPIGGSIMIENDKEMKEIIKKYKDLYEGIE